MLTLLADFYHVKCFEKLVDLSKTEFLRRVEPLTRANCFARGLRMTAISSGNYLLDGGAERLVVYWVDSMRRLVAERDGIERKPCDVVLMDLLNRAGSASYTPKQPNNMSDSEYFKLRHSLATIESDGPEDKDEWNLIDQLVPLTFDGLDDLKETHSLSAMLRAWRARRVS